LVKFNTEKVKEPIAHNSTKNVYAIKEEIQLPMEWNSAKLRDKERKVPQPIVLEVLINRNPA
jgi:hypothetical protein